MELFEKGNGGKEDNVRTVLCVRFCKHECLFVYDTACFFNQIFKPLQGCARGNNVVYDAYFFTLDKVNVVLGKVEFLGLPQRRVLLPFPSRILRKDQTYFMLLSLFSLPCF